MKDRILKLLINGLGPSEVAQIVGCSPGYVSQLCKDTDFLSAIEAGKIESSTKNTEEEHLDTRYQSLEHKLLSAANNTIGEASFSEIINAIEKINKRKDQVHARKNPIQPSASDKFLTVNVVSLQLPAHAIANNNPPVITLNDKQEIIAIGEQALAPMSSDAVKNLFAARMAKVVSEADLINEL